MPQPPPSPAVTVHRGDGLVTVVVHGEPDPPTVAQVRERIASLTEGSLQRLVLNLVNISDRFSAECLALIAVVQHLIQASCVLNVCTSSPAVQVILALAGWSQPEPAGRPCLVLYPGNRECPIQGAPRDAGRCSGPLHPGGEG